MKFADLHLHTVFSDGVYTASDLISASKRAGLLAIAVCDHDTTDGLPPAIEAAKEDGVVEVLPGIEMSAENEGSEVHILGYLIDRENEALKERLSSLKNNRIERIYKMTARLKELGLNLSAEDVFAIAGKGTVGRLHVARAMLKAGLVTSIIEAFQKYIGDNGPAYVLGFKLQVPEAISLIREAGGISVLAHPYTVKNDDLIREFARQGLMGIEAYYPEHSQSMVNFYLQLAKELNLLVTGGSDCHGSAKAEAKIGSLKIPYELVEKLKEAKSKL